MVRHSSALENQFQSELHLPWRVRAGGPCKVCGALVVRRKVVDSNSLIELNEIRGGAGETVVRDDDPLIVSV